ncbi:hypothetical protein HCG51_31610 [Tolypothrix sp. PCC 7910]|uniref:hypothetical protein n=1 Tax=Tolypothrix sp. PCC 7910 TaxID=2099387 RepID=UPI00142788E6|nr:hypothetical protein [Tolypothrix sp. PCC 7910]QIR40792.1 hypothetical protein HCG51_31610 [Tolypothrix sp. PCC 7910]
MSPNITDESYQILTSKSFLATCGNNSALTTAYSQLFQPQVVIYLHKYGNFIDFMLLN